MTKDPRDCALKAANILEDKKGQDVVVMDIRSVAVFADYFVIASGLSPLHVQALSDEVEEKLTEEGYILRSKEGYSEAKWVLLDFYDVIVHIFTAAEREYYMLERLWADATVIKDSRDTVNSQEDLDYT